MVGTYVLNLMDKAAISEASVFGIIKSDVGVYLHYHPVGCTNVIDRASVGTSTVGLLLFSTWGIYSL